LSLRSNRLFRRAVALPTDHGSWIFLLTPIAIGLYVGGRWTTPSAYLVMAALTGFLLRQPLTIAIKVLSGRRSRADLPAALFWVAVYSAVGLAHVTGLALRGYGYVLYLAIPGVAVFAWHLYLVSRRQERDQLAIELLGSGVLALSATGAYWVGVGRPDAYGWLLWGLAWIQSAASILYVHLRLDQRSAAEDLPWGELVAMARPALALATLNLGFVSALCAANIVPLWLFLPYLVQWLEVLRGTLQPAFALQPKAIGFRQLAVSTLFTLLFILTWN
jgi:hypothetical protein